MKKASIRQSEPLGPRLGSLREQERHNVTVITVGSRNYSYVRSPASSHMQPFVTWYPTETIEIRLILSSRRNEQWQTVKDTVKKEYRSQRGYQQMLVLSNLRSPDTGREKEREAKWLAGALKRKWHPSPRRRKKTRRNVSYWKGLVADRPIAFTPGEEDKNISWTRGTQVLQASVKNSIKSISPWKKKDSPVEPRRKIRYVTLGLFLLIPNFIYHSLSLNLKEHERTEKKEDIYIHGLFNYYMFWHFESVSLCIVKDSCVLMLPRGRSCSLPCLLRICYLMLPFQLLFALCYLA